MNEAQLKQKPEDLSDEERIDRMIRRLKEMRHLTKILEQQNKEKGIIDANDSRSGNSQSL